ncbi:MAG: isochorismate synthase [Bacteroidales bacterium]
MRKEVKIEGDWVKDLIRKGWAFALFRLPQTKEPILIVQTAGTPLQLNDYSELNDKNGFVFAPFVISEAHPLLLIRSDVQCVGTDEIQGWIADNRLSGTGLSLEKEFCTTENRTAGYDQVFGTFLEALKNQKFEKLVLSRYKDRPIAHELQFTALFESASDRYPNGFTYMVYTPQAGLWMGSTPEILLAGKENLFSTVALAGTMKASDTPVWSEKNKLEQEYVAQYLREKLHSLGIEPEERGPVTAKAGALVHLKSVFNFSLSDSDHLGDVIAMLHPTPAVCGLPKEEAYHFICAHEGYDRSYYSGFLGPLQHLGKTDLYVNLRCMRITPSFVRLFAGGGLLTSSELESEWSETEDKMQTMLSLLN